MKYLFFLLLSISVNAQNIVSGNVFSEQGYTLQNVLIVNITTEERTTSNDKGFFSIQAKISDELRFVKDNYERGSRKIFYQDFSNLISITLIQKPTEIEEVKLTINPTGDLNKDINFNSSKKTSKLNTDIAEYVKKPMTEIQPKSKIPSSFAPRDPYSGQLNLLSISFGDNSSGGIIGLLMKEGFKKTLYKPNFSEKQAFYKKIKDSLYGDYFINSGLNEFEFEEYVIHIDKKFNLSETYWNNFNKIEINNLLKESLNEYIKYKK